MVRPTVALFDDFTVDEVGKHICYLTLEIAVEGGDRDVANKRVPIAFEYCPRV